MTEMRERVAAALAQGDRNMPSACPPLPGQYIVDRDGHIWLPSLDGGEPVRCFVHAGIRTAWIPVPDLGGVVFVQLGGSGAEDGYDEEGLCALMTPAGLRAYAAELGAIADQVEAMSS